jgi:hypothetical protein
MIGLMLPVIRNISEIHHAGTCPFQQVFRQTRRQHCIHHRLQLDQLFVVNGSAQTAFPTLFALGAASSNLHAASPVVCCTATVTNIAQMVLVSSRCGSRPTRHTFAEPCSSFRNVVRSQSLRYSRLSAGYLDCPFGLDSQKRSSKLPPFSNRTLIRCGLLNLINQDNRPWALLSVEQSTIC